MSAIAGIYHLNEEPIHIDLGLEMMKRLEKYPADDIQVWHTSRVFLGCHAQWITPESIGEQLPFYDFERKMAITSDAIIDNREELFQVLSIERHKRSKMSDSELILHAYAKWGTNTPQHLIGEFAFVIWDERKQQLFGARDFSGSRTLYFHRNKNKFSFCTILDPLLGLPYVEKRLNEYWLAEFLAIPGMIDTVDTRMTAYEGIEQIPPSHAIIVTQSGLQFLKYNVIQANETLRFKKDEDYEEAFRYILQRSITDRLRTHREVGSHLSGGLDSGAVASFAANILKSNNKTLFTYSYVPEDDFIDWTPKHRVADEREYIQEIVSYVGNMNAHYLDFKGKNSYSEIDLWLEMIQMPYKSFENSFWVRGFFEKAREHGVGVLLNGARGNLSISWGRALDYYAKLLKRLQWFQLYREMTQYSQSIEASRMRVMQVVSRKAFPYMQRQRAESEDFPRLIHLELAQKTNVYEKLREHGLNETGFISNNIYEIRRQHFLQDFMWKATGTIQTKMSLRYGLWQRDPCNDPRVIQFCLSVPEKQFVREGMGRALIRRSTLNVLPNKVRLNQLFRGIQGADWVHRMTSVWPSFVEESEGMLSDQRLANYVDLKNLRQAITKVKEGPITAYTFDPDLRNVMRVLIIKRFLHTIV